MTAFDTAPQSTVTVRAYLQLLWRRKWLVLAAVIVAPAIAYVFTSREATTYQASAQVLLLNPPTATASTQSTGFFVLPVIPNTIDTQTALARSSAVASLAVTDGHLGIPPGTFLGETSIAFDPSGTIVTLTATTPDAPTAPRIANAYARAYVKYRYANETSGLNAVAKTLQARLSATPRGAGRAAIATQLQEVRAEQALHVADARVFQLATGAGALRPPTKRNVALGLVLGLVLGLGLAFLLDALDTRVRSVDVIEERLGLPLLARLPEPPKALQNAYQLAMVTDPTGPGAEAFRMLRTNIEFAMLDRDIRTVMITSAVEEEGKSTTIANLAVAFARLGRPVTLVDLDLRRPMLHRFFPVTGRPGLAEVVLGHASLDEALAEFDFRGDNEFGDGNGNGKDPNGNGLAVSSDRSAPLSVLALGLTPPNPGEFVASRPLSNLLDTLRARGDLVLIDAPPLFHVGDGLALSAKVDAVVLAVKMEVARRPELSRLKRMLETMPAHPLGVVVTGVSFEDAYYGYGYGAYSYTRGAAPAEAAKA
jgi:Mrp family chromosome partitioning ATPase/capsular polysaccharide biosynthesis protein